MNLIYIIGCGLLLALGSSFNSLIINDIPVIYLILGITFLIHWLIFIPAYMLRTEKFFDITGTITFLSILIFSIYIKSFKLNLPIRETDYILCMLISIWAIRLGLFLLFRILKEGEDKRFRIYKKSFYSFLIPWSLSALWVFITSLTATTSILSNSINVNHHFTLIGTIIWIIGFVLEVIADIQKSYFKSKSKNDGKFITTGLWSFSRHPNYLGEIMLWIGIAIISIPNLNGLQFISLISPIFVYLLLTKISGINLLEQKSNKQWGNLDEYKNYKRNTPILFPFLKK